jgi:hypothetical protein
MKKTGNEPLDMLIGMVETMTEELIDSQETSREARMALSQNHFLVEVLINELARKDLLLQTMTLLSTT